MDEACRSILHRVGVILLVVGCLDVLLMIYCIATETAYASSFNVFAVIAGILLMRGSLKTAKIVANFSAFLLACSITLIVALPLFIPISFLGTLFRIEPGKVIASALVMFLFITLLWWTHVNLTSVPIATAFRDAQIKPSRHVWSLLAGVVLVGVLAVVFHVAENSDSARAELAKIEKEHGDRQRYFFSSYNSRTVQGKTAVKATITGYTANSIKTYEVSWEE